MTLRAVPRYDPDRLGTVGDRAVVVGGSIAGLTAARVLADGFTDVVVLERDPIPDAPTARDGAPQSRHPHVLLEGGRATLEDLLPGFGEALLGGGGLLIDSGSDMAYYDEGGFLADPNERLPTYSASRALLEHVVREQVRAHDPVDLRGGQQVTGYRLDGTGDRVTGVRVRAGGGRERVLDADLVVDASGRTSRTPAWLDDHGYDPVTVDEVGVDVSYSSARIERPAGDRRVYLVPPSAPRTRGAAAIPVEDGRWEVILQGMHGEGSPGTREEVREFLTDLPVPELEQLVRRHAWVSDDVERYPFPASRRRRYGSLETFPDGLVVTGDAIASFNPVYGQGMSVAALEALQLHHTLAAGGLDDVGPRFFDRAATVVEDVWRLAVGADFAFEGTTGEKPIGTDLLNRYVDRLKRRAHDDSVLAAAFMRVTRLERSPSTLFRPTLAWRVLRPRPGLPSPGAPTEAGGEDPRTPDEDLASTPH